VDIVRALPEKVSISISSEGERVVVKAGKSRFVLSTLPASDFPTIEDIQAKHVFRILRQDLARLLEKTHFSMAQQDVRYYLNGMLLEVQGAVLRGVATDGHRLALCEIKLTTPGDETPLQVIVPRKGVLELQRILSGEGDLEFQIGTNHFRVQIGDIRFTSKLIDGRFPEYGRVIPSNPPRIVTTDRTQLRTALQRAAILSNEKYRGIRFGLKSRLLVLQAHNPEQEEAEEEIEVDYDGEEMEIGFNVNYLMDALGAVDGATVELGLTDANNSCVVRTPGDQQTTYVVMPMRL